VSKPYPRRSRSNTPAALHDVDVAQICIDGDLPHRLCRSLQAGVIRCSRRRTDGIAQRGKLRASGLRARTLLDSAALTSWTFPQYCTINPAHLGSTLFRLSLVHTQLVIAGCMP
jgi:hypothetical protein